MSRVFLALERVLDRKVVVKVLLPELAAGVNVDRFRREIQLAAQLQHPHIVPLLSAGEAEGLPYFVMPYVSGESLRARVVREGEFPIAETVRILRDVVSALAYAHARGVIHRDVKPDNVLLSGGVAVVTDFGVAKAVSASSGAGGSSSLTSLGVALGTPAYMAPEQATATPNTDHRADIYALGIMTYEMLTGMPPFSGRSAQQVLAAHVIEEPEPVERRRPGTPSMLATLVKDCLAKRPADRPQTATEVMHVLDAIATPSGGTVATTAVRRPAVTVDTGRRRGALVASLIGLALLVGGGVVWLQRAEPSPVLGGSMQGPGVLTPGPSDSVAPPQPSGDAGKMERIKPDPPVEERTQPRIRRTAPAARESVGMRAAAPPPVAESSVAPPVVAAPPAPAPAPPVNQVESVPAEVSPPAPAPTPPPAAAPAPAPSPPPPPIDPLPSIREVVAAYAKAIESETVSDLRRVYPGMTSMQQRGWEQFFQLVRDIKANLSVGQLDRSTGTAQVTGTYTYLNTSTGRSENQPVSFQASFRNQGGQWRISQVR
jgi:serine/threonine-protein kinase